MRTPVTLATLDNGPHRPSRHLSHKRNLTDPPARCKHRHDC